MLEPLATVDNLATRLGLTFTTDQINRAAALLDDASAAVRNYTRQQITMSTDTVTLESTQEQWLYLPERPVLSVSSIVIGSAELATAYWTLQNDALYRFYGWSGRFYGSTATWNQPDTITVTYTHGYAEIPSDIVRVVCKLAEASWLNPQGYRSATVGGVSVTLARETLGVGSLDDDDKRALDFYRRPRRSVQLAARLV